MDELMKPRLEEEKKKQVEQARVETLENAIAIVKQKIKDQQEAEKQAAKSETGMCPDFLFCCIFFFFMPNIVY